MTNQNNNGSFPTVWPAGNTTEGASQALESESHHTRPSDPENVRCYKNTKANNLHRGRVWEARGKG